MLDKRAQYTVELIIYVMKTLPKICIDYRYRNWGKTERIICEQDGINDQVFLLIKQGQNVGTIFKQDNHWKSNCNNIFLPVDISKIGQLIDQHLVRLGRYPMK